MTEKELRGLLTDLRRASAARGSAVRAQFGAPALRSTVDHCSELANTAFPQSLVMFFSTWNGLAIDYYDDSTAEIHEPGPSSVRFELLSAELVVKATAAFREFLYLASRDVIELRHTERLASGVLVISQENDFVQYMALDRCDTSGECPIMALDLQYYEDWLESPGEPVALSLDDYLRRCIKHMARTGKHFYYWLDQLPE